MDVIQRWSLDTCGCSTLEACDVDTRVTRFVTREDALNIIARQHAVDPKQISVSEWQEKIPANTSTPLCPVHQHLGRTQAWFNTLQEEVRRKNAVYGMIKSLQPLMVDDDFQLGTVWSWDNSRNLLIDLETLAAIMETRIIQARVKRDLEIGVLPTIPTRASLGLRWSVTQKNNLRDIAAVQFGPGAVVVT